MAKKTRPSRRAGRRASVAPAQGATGTIQGQASRRLSVVSGFLTQAADRILLSIGGLSVEVLTAASVPQNDPALQQARKATVSALGGLIGQNVQLRGYQADGYLLSAKSTARLGVVPVKQKERSRFLKVEQVLEDNRQNLLSIPGVIGARPGYRFKDGGITDEPCIVVLVDHKLPKADLPTSARIPDKLDTVDIDVALASPVQQFVSQTVRQGRTVSVDPANPEGFAVPSAGGSTAQLAFESITAQLLRESKYVPPDDVHLEPVNGPFLVKCHASPDAGWPTLSSFLAGTKSSLTIAMYDFTAPHIMRAIEATATENDATVSLIL